MKRNTLRVLLPLLALAALASCHRARYDYETVEGDPLGTKIYTLENGLRVYMSVNPEQPRIQANIAVHAGSKHEPAETTGLAHYLEHMLFKGSEHFGTLDYAREKPLLDSIRDLYEQYRATRGEEERRALYRRIDSVSYRASALFIPNEYDKMMAHIGSEGTNAYTSYDETVYVENIPSNEAESWAKVQSDRFKHMVLRGFHTELEAVYEEYNKYLNSDWDKLSCATFGALTPTHPYRRSVIGLGEHLKNPSIAHIERFFRTYYVPNNMAICLSGDFDPDDMVDIIRKYFGDMRPNKALRQPAFAAQPALDSARSRRVVTPNPESILMSWRFEGEASRQSDTLAILAQVLHNGTAGLLDLDLNLPQRVNGSSSELFSLRDYSVLSLAAQPQPGQTLDDLRALLEAEAAKAREGRFADSLVRGIITEQKLALQRALEDNSERARILVECFVRDIPYADRAARLARMERITKDDVAAFARRHLRGDNFVAVYKRQGQDKSVRPVAKPAITPIRMNRDSTSAFARAILRHEARPVEPRFLDFGRDVTALTTRGGARLLCHRNTLNSLFKLTYHYDFGQAADRRLPLALDYMRLLGTGSLTAARLQQRLYTLGCQLEVSAGRLTTDITLSGLQESMEPAAALVESLLRDARGDKETLRGLVTTELRQRENYTQMFDYYSYFLRDYLRYGLPGVELELTNAELAAADGDTLLSLARSLAGTSHTVLYYGPLSPEDALALVDKCHPARDLRPAPKAGAPAQQRVPEDVCYLFPYKGTTSFVMSQYAYLGKPWDASTLGITALYNEYFGAGMNTVVFQEMREKRSLCYGAGARYVLPERPEERAAFTTSIQSQNDKLSDCVTVFRDITDNMPLSQTSFDVAKKGLLSQLRTTRVTRDAVLDAYLRAERLGIDYDPRAKVYEQALHATMDDLRAFQQARVKGLKYRSVIAGDPEGLDPAALHRLGPVTTLTAHEVFGY